MRAEHYPAIVLGATVRGCGIAAATPGSLILDPEILPGANWALTFDPGRNWEAAAPEIPVARRLLDELCNRKAVVAGALNNAAFAPVFARLCLDGGWKFKLDSRVVSVEGDTVSYFDAEGMHQVRGDRVIDAAPRFDNGKKYVTALLQTPDPTGPAKFGEVEILPRSNSEAVVMLPLPATDEWPEARRKFRAFWEARPAPLREAAVLLTAVRFAERRFDKPVAELEAGWKEAAK